MEISIQITGTAPLLMHKPTLVDPLGDASRQFKKISSKRTKSDEDQLMMRRLEFEAGLYFHPEVGPYIPGEMIYSSLRAAAKITKSGPKVERGLLFVSPINRLEYEGPRTVADLWNDPRFRHVHRIANQGRNSVMRCRPVFPEWSCRAVAMINPEIVGADDLTDIAVNAGSMTGLGDWRPAKGGSYGRFEAKVQ